MRSSNESMAWTSVASLALHGAFAAALALAPRPAPTPPPVLAAEVRLEVGAMTIPDEMEEEIEEMLETLPPPAATASREPLRPTTRPLVPSTSTGAPSDVVPTGTLVAAPGATSVGTLVVGPETDAEREARLRAARIDPTTAAARTVFRDDPGPIMPSGPAGLGPAGETVRPMSVAEAEALHSEHLGAVAATKTHLSHTRPPLAGPHADGSYTYAGHAFTATIHADGSVSYSDRGAVEYDLGSGSGSFDLGDMVMGAAGADPRAAERTWFEEEHAELIERLENEHRLTTRASALRGVRNQVRMLWADRTESAASRREQLFEIWDDLSEAEGDRAARDAVIAFIRAELPATSEDAYTDSELSTFNARRASTERFAPY